MMRKVKDMKTALAEPVVVKEECHHHWLIESAKGPTSRGVCKLCGAKREFLNSLPVPESTTVRRHVPFNELPELKVKADSKASKS